MSRRSVLAATGTGILGGLASGSGTAVASELDDHHQKTRPTVFTEEMRQNARTNVGRYDWAKGQRDSAVDQADSHLERWGPDLDSLWSLITSQQIPRGAGRPAERKVLGGISQPGTDRLWKIETTVENPHGDGNLVVPTNDFAAYRESGLDDRGMFDPELADDQYLVNEEHPEMGEGWGVDDGWGWHDENNDLGEGEDHRWNFVAYYNHWFVWRPGGVDRLVPDLTDAYLLSGDSKYAVAGLVLLDRIADVYPEMSIWDYQSGEHGFLNNHGGRQTGRILGGSWEPNLVDPILRAYDAFFPALDDDAVADEVLTFLGGKTEEFPGLSSKDSVATIRENIEQNFVQEMLPAAKESDLVPSRGQRPTVALSARVQDDVGDDGYTKNALEWLFQPGGEVFVGDVWNEEPENWKTTGGEMLVPLVDECDRDGYWPEAAQLYNEIRMSSVREVAETLQGYDGFDGADLYQHPKMQRALGINSHLLLLDNLVPEIGDTHAYQDGGDELWLNSSAIEDGYEVTGKPYFGQLWHFANGYSTAGVRGSIYDSEPEALGDEIQAIIDAEGPLDLPSQNLAGYGFAALRDGENYKAGSAGISYELTYLPREASTEVQEYSSPAIQLNADEAGHWIEFEFEVPSTDEYEIIMEANMAPSYGIYEAFVSGESIGTYDFYGTPNLTMEALLELEAGTHTIRFENRGKNEESSNYRVAFYDVQLLDSEAREKRENVRELGNAKRALWMYYGRSGNEGGGTSHGHRDTLNVGVAAHEMELARDLGYPEETSDYPPRHLFTGNTISHNTVTVDGKGQKEQWVGEPRHFDGSSERVNLVDVEAPHVYDVTDEYRRTTAMITIDDERSYAVDFFRVAGGDDHRFSFHGTKADVTTEGLDLDAQNSGTLAGEDIPYGDGEYNAGLDDGPRSEGAGLNYFDNVEHDDDPSEKVVVEWDVEDHFDVRADDAENVHLRLTSFGDFDEVTLADAYPPESSGGAEPEPSIRYAFLQRSGSNLESNFVSTIEHYDGERAVESVEEVDVIGGDGRALKVELSTGRTDYVVRTLDGSSTLTVDDTFQMRGFFGVLSLADGQPEFAYLNDGTLLRTLDGEPLIQRPYGRFTGTVRDFTRGMSVENELDVQLDGHQQDAASIDADEATSADFAYVDVDGPRGERGRRGVGNGAYPIEGVEIERGNLVRIDVGDRTFSWGFVDPDELESGGYKYIVSEDDEVVIPVTETWSRS